MVQDWNPDVTKNGLVSRVQMSPELDDTLVTESRLNGEKSTNCR